MLQKTKSLLTKCLAFLFIVCCVVAATVGLVACSNEKTVAGISVNNGKLIVKYSDGTSDDLTLVVEKPACEHKNTTKIVSANGTCEENVLTVCNDCGHVSAEVVSTHQYSVEARHLARKNCLVGARTAKVCVKCDDEIEVVYDEGDDGVCYTEHQNVIEATYLLDKNNIANPNKCEAETVKAKICVECNETVEVISVTPASGHTYGEWSWATEPNDTTAGVAKRNCTVCGKPQTKEVPALYVLDKDGNKTETVNSDYTFELGKEALCSATGRHDSFNYTIDGKVLKVEKVAKSDHYVVIDNKIVTFENGKAYDVADYDNKLKPLGGFLTCLNAGSNGVFECEGCEGTYNVKVRKTHKAYNEKDDVVVREKSKAATCTADGLLTYICSECKDEAEKVLPKLGHNITCDEVIKTEVEGVTKWTFKVHCTRCSEDIPDVVTEVGPTVKEVAATCTDKAYTVYTDIKDANGNVIMDSADNTKALEIWVETGDALGHNHKDLGAVDATKAYDLNDAKYKGMFKPVGVVDFNCGEHDVTDPIQGVYTCTRCDALIEVKVYKSHTGEVVTVDQPTCVEPGKQLIKDCSVCGAKDVEKTIPATGHTYNYTYETDEFTGKVVKLIGVCVNDGCKAETEGHTVTLVKDVDFTDCVIVSNNDCKKTGAATYTDLSGEKHDIVLAVSEHHTLNGVVMVSDWQHPYSDKTAGIRPYNGAKFNCEELTAESKENGIFVCDVCEGYYTVFVKVEHTKTNVTTTVPTCEVAGKEKYDCSVCGAKGLTEEIPALGHDVEYKVDSKAMTVTITCKREGCAHNTATEGGAAVVIHLPAVPAVTVVDGEIVIAASDYYTVTEIAPVSCASAGLYKYELKDAALKGLLKVAVDEKAVSAYGDTIKVAFEGEVTTPHTFEGEEITWIVDGYKYIGKYCTGCGNVVVLAREALY